MRNPEAMKLDRGSIVYRGEGNATLVIALKNKGKVLRFQKYPTDQPMAFENLIEADLQRHIWFSSNVLRKILFREMFDEPSMVRLSEEDMKYINKLWNESRPGYRVCKVIPNQNSWALLLNDYCCLPIAPSLKNYVVGPVITVEIKPKQGFPPIICKHEASVCRFSLKQAFKLESSRTRTESHYCPLNLFSGCQTRMRTALKNLIITPQNNFRLFRDAELMYSEQNAKTLNLLLSGFIDDNLNEDQRSERVLIDLIIDSLMLPFGETSSVIPYLDFQNATPNYCSYHHTPPCDFNCKASHDLPSKCVLATVLRLQMLDTIGSYGALNIFNSLSCLSPESIAQLESFGESHHDGVPFPPKGFGSPFRLPKETEVDYYLRKLWEYLISIIAKDCSIMISMQRLEDFNPSRCMCSAECQEIWSKTHSSKCKRGTNFAKDIHKSLTSSRCHIIHDKTTNTPYTVSIAIIDLDLKKSSKIMDVYNREMKIIEAFNNHIAAVT